ncbi:MAG: hypothetical protein BWK78_05805 [Thiotrichaceae bacterium IS1]|nr:MAG: hypothetical protein BWK78_05805 [Thiotrichaceae bacterium IS1]
MNQNDKTVDIAKLYQLGMLSLVISAVFLIFSYWGVGYTTNDETKYERWALANSQYFSLDTVVNATKIPNQERITILIGYYVVTFPHWLSALCGYHFLNVLNLCAIFTALGLFSLVVYKVTRQKLFALFLGLFFLVAIQNSWDHNVLTSYTFPMNFSISLLLVSLVLFLEYLSSGRRLLWGLSVMVFLLMLFASYEFFLFYTAIFVVVAFYGIKTTTSTQVAVLKTLYVSMPYFISVIIFVLLYFIYKYLLGYYNDGWNITAYKELHTAPLSFSNILNVIYQYTVASFPTYIYFHYASLFDTYSDLVSGHNYTVSSFLEHLKAEWLVKSIVVSYFVYALLQNRLVAISGRMFVGLVIISLYVMVVPNILVAITTKHQEWTTTYGALLYTTTYFSYFGTVLLLVTSIVFFNQFLPCKGLTGLVIKRVSVFLLAIGMAFISLATDYSNYYVFKDQKLSQYKWNMVDTFIQAGGLQSVPPGSFVYAPSLWQHHWSVVNEPFYWSEYLRLKYKKDITVSDSLVELQKRVAEQGVNELYYLKFSQERKDYNQFILFAKINELGVSRNLRKLPLASAAQIISNSKHRVFTVFGRVLSSSSNGKVPAVVTLDGIQANQEGNFFSAVLNKEYGPKYDHTLTTISSNGLLDLESISLSNYTDHQLLTMDDPLLLHFSLDWGKGFYPEEAHNTDYWHWSEQESELYLNNFSQKTVTTILNLKFVTPGEQRTAIKIEGDLLNEKVINPTQNVQDYTAKIVLPPGRHKIKFSTTAKQLVTPADSRRIFFSVSNYRLSILDEEGKK